VGLCVPGTSGAEIPVDGAAVPGISVSDATSDTQKDGILINTDTISSEMAQIGIHRDTILRQISRRVPVTSKSPSEDVNCNDRGYRTL
jgi:hypothetical protein